MDAALVISRLLLAVVFLVSGLAKLVDQQGSRQAFVDFGLPRRLAGPLGYGLPLAELAVAVALLPTATAWYAAIGASALLVVFLLGMGVNLARGRRPDCHCFGQVHSAPIGPGSLVRNGVLLAVAVFIVWEGRISPGPSVAWIKGLTAMERISLALAVILLILLAAAAWLLFQVLRQQGRFLLRLEALEARLAGTASAPRPAQTPTTPLPTAGLPVGMSAPRFQLKGLRGEVVTLDSLLADGKPVLLLFTHPTCGPCQALMPEIGRWQRQHAEHLDVVIVTEGAVADNLATSSEFGLTHVLLQQKREAAEAYRSAGTPAAVLVRTNGTIGSPLALGADAIRDLLARTVDRPVPTPIELTPSSAGIRANGHPSGGSNGTANGAVQPDRAPANRVKLGEPAPPLTLTDLAGQPVVFASFQGRKTMLLFWNPGCGFCGAMLDDLKAWESNPPEGSPQLLVISSGAVDANRALGLRSPIVLDPEFKAGRTFGAGGTPMAVLLDQEGRVASEVVAGAQAVLQLAVGSAKLARGAQSSIRR